ncbi:hypothetical protein P8605_25120, partial [Streptomyces sp. T-3]|nr:hypothetical protein [Streptomyces sp. T-3]
LTRPGLHRTIALAHRSDVAPPRAARELQSMLLKPAAGPSKGSGTVTGTRPGRTRAARPRR